MSTLLEIKTACANYLNINVSDLTQNSQDLFLVAANEVRKMAELANDFEFSRKTLSLTVNGTTGGNLALAQDSLGTTYEVKTVIDVGTINTSGNLCPVEWTTTSESLTRQREDNHGAWPRYPTDDMARETPWGGSRFTFSGNAVAKWPRLSETDATDYVLYLEGYTFQNDWVAADLLTTSLVVTGTLSPNLVGIYYVIGTDGTPRNVYVRSGANVSKIESFAGQWILDKFEGNAQWLGPTNASPVGSYTPQSPSTGTATVTATTSTSDIWTTHGQKYLLWATLVQLNHIWRRWVARQEGNLPPPAQLAEEGLQALIQWDAYRFEGFRTHNR